MVFFKENRRALYYCSGGTQIVFSEGAGSTDNTFIIYLGIGFDTAIVGDASFEQTELSERACF